MRLLSSRGAEHAPRCGALSLMVESSMGSLARCGHWSEVAIGVGDEVVVGKRTSLAGNISFDCSTYLYPSHIPLPSLMFFCHPHTFRSSFNK
jgi:hypothetical protein